MYLYKELLLKRKWNYFVSGIVAILVKVAIIYLGFSALNLFGAFPAKIVANIQNSMGLTQGITATIAMIVTYTLYAVNNKKSS